MQMTNTGQIIITAESVETYIRCCENPTLERTLGLLELWLCCHDMRGLPITQTIGNLAQSLDSKAARAAFRAFQWYLAGK